MKSEQEEIKSAKGGRLALIGDPCTPMIEMRPRGIRKTSFMITNAPNVSS